MKAQIKYMLAALVILMAAHVPSWAGDFESSTESGPPPVSAGSSIGGVPIPPVCNTSTQKLHWNGSGWKCIGVGHAISASSAASVSGYAKGSTVSSGDYGTWAGSPRCPSGTSAVITQKATGGGVSAQPGRYICVRN